VDASTGVGAGVNGTFIAIIAVLGFADTFPVKTILIHGAAVIIVALEGIVGVHATEGGITYIGGAEIPIVAVQILGSGYARSVFAPIPTGTLVIIVAGCIVIAVGTTCIR